MCEWLCPSTVTYLAFHWVPFHEVCLGPQIKKVTNDALNLCCTFQKMVANLAQHCQAKKSWHYRVTSRQTLIVCCCMV